MGVPRVSERKNMFGNMAFTVQETLFVQKH
jgi:hypothetical protein